jgi:hypothetical protein
MQLSAAERQMNRVAALVLLACFILFSPQKTNAEAANQKSLKTSEAREAASVFRVFVKARSEYDVPKVDSLEADDHVWIEFTGERRPKDKTGIRNIVEWEKVMDTKWECRILGYQGGELAVEMREHNRLYDVLGIGFAIRQQRERISSGQLHESRVVGLRFAGRDQDEAVAEFEKWIQQKPADQQEGVLHNGHLIFNGAAAQKEIPLLEEWRRIHNSHSIP